jgi:hypothetical protein
MLSFTFGLTFTTAAGSESFCNPGAPLGSSWARAHATMVGIAATLSSFQTSIVVTGVAGIHLCQAVGNRATTISDRRCNPLMRHHVNEARTVRTALNLLIPPLFWEQGAAGSNPAAPTNDFKALGGSPASAGLLL